MRCHVTFAYERSLSNSEWLLWFAWRPVTLPSGETVWLEMIERRAYASWGGGGWEYRNG